VWRYVSVAAVLACAALAACSRTDDQHATLGDFVQLLERSGNATYTAEYLTGAGLTVTHVQAPPAQAYRSTLGRYVLAPDSAYLCRASSQGCERVPGDDSLPMPHARLVSGTVAAGVPAPELAESLLVRAAAGAHVSRGTREIAGLRVVCIELSGRSTVRACATDTGVLALFEGVLDGSTTPERVEIDRYSPTADPAELAPPTGVRIEDVDSLT